MLAESTLASAIAARHVVCSQVLMEFWVVATRPVSVNGYGLGVSDADACFEEILNLCEFLPDPPDLFEHWRDLAVAHQVHGKTAHDARLVALLQLYEGDRITTFNPRDFARYPDIQVIEPRV